ncbi:MAG TPA: antibiotic biosynthesis monooxygenase [Albitalea sp.]
MVAVMFEVVAKAGREQDYLDTAAALKGLLHGVDGFVSVERFRSLADPRKLLSLSFWRDEDALARWRNTEAHRRAQALGRGTVFEDYRLRIAVVSRDYGMNDRAQAPDDSRAAHGA